MELTNENRREWFKECDKLAISKNSIVLYPDQQRILLSDCKIDKQDNVIVFGGTREDGTICLVKVKFEKDKPIDYYLEDMENALSTLASYCSPTGKLELDKYGSPIQEL